jgi:solute carrier family 25 phosphate transporter 23/24/25/41
LIAKEEGVKGYWKGNLPQVIRVLPYSAVQLLAYESYKNLFKGKDDQLSVIGRLAAGACAGMTSTLVSNCGLIYSCLLYLFIRFRVYSFVGVN